MLQRTLAGRVLILVVVATATVLVWNTSVIMDATRAIEQPETAKTITRTASNMELTTTWNALVEGLPTVITVTTVCGIDYNGNPIPNETEEECIERHRAKVARLKALFPPTR